MMIGIIRTRRVPENIEKYLTPPSPFTGAPFSLAIWIMDDGSRVGKGLKQSTNNLTQRVECEKLAKILHKKFDLKVSIQKTGSVNQWH